VVIETLFDKFSTYDGEAGRKCPLCRPLWLCHWHGRQPHKCNVCTSLALVTVPRCLVTRKLC